MARSVGQQVEPDGDAAEEHGQHERDEHSAGQGEEDVAAPTAQLGAAERHHPRGPVGWIGLTPPKRGGSVPRQPGPTSGPVRSSGVTRRRTTPAR